MAISFRALKGCLSNVMGTVKTGNFRSHTGLLTLNSATPCNCYITLTPGHRPKALTKEPASTLHPTPCPTLQSVCRSSSVCLPQVRTDAPANDVAFAPELVEYLGCPVDVIGGAVPSDHGRLPFLELRGEHDDVGDGARISPTTAVLSGYLDAQPYQVYCFDVDRQMAARMVLSDYEREVLQFSGTPAAQADEKPRDHPGRASEEQLQRLQTALAETLPKFFTEPHNYSLYHKGIVFRNNIRGVTTQGLPGYVQQLALVRMLGHLRYAHVKLEVLKMTVHREDSTVRIRWRIVGLSGLRVLFMFWKFRIWEWKKMMSREAEWTDGFSVMKVGADGLIHEHTCDKIMPDDDLEKVLKPSNVAVKLALLLGLTPQSISFGSSAMASSEDGLL